MPRLLPAFLAACTVFVLSLSAFADREGWLVDYPKAVAQAKAENKLVLLQFTGSDWNSTCQKQDAEVFAKPAFKEYATKNLVLLEVDFPKKKELPSPVADQNKELNAKYSIRSFPTLVVVNGDGQEVGRLVGYGGGGADIVVAKIDAFRK